MSDTEPTLTSHRDRIHFQRNQANEIIKKVSAGDRHLHDLSGWGERRPLNHVESFLPTFHGKELTTIVSSLPTHSRIWDLGSGDAAIALSELVAKYPDMHLQGTGVTLPLERENLNHPENVDVKRMDVDEFLKKFDSAQRPDLIYTVQMLRWSPSMVNDKICL